MSFAIAAELVDPNQSAILRLGLNKSCLSCLIVGGGHIRTERLLGTRAALAAPPHTDMATFVYRCPNTGMNVQGWVADDPTEHDDAYEAIPCTICTRVHLVNPKTGKVIGADED